MHRATTQGRVMSLVLALICLLLAARASTGGSPPSTSFGQWVTFGGGTGAGPNLFHKVNGLWQFTVPTEASKSTVNYAYTKAPALQLGQTVTLNYGVEGNATFAPLPQKECGGVSGCGPAKIRLFLWEAGDDLSCAKGSYEGYRQWSDEALLVLGDNQTLSAVLDPSKWTDCFGNNFGLAQAVQHAQWIGFTFGGNFAGHGVWTTKGSATFTINSYTIE